MILGHGLLAILLSIGEAAPAQGRREEDSRDAREAEDEDRPAYEEVVIVSVSRLEEQLVNAPASVTVIASAEVEASPAQNYGDLLRSVPGLNVIQLSARDINLASREQTGTIVTSQLALLDGRTVYQDFFGLVLWDLLPVSPTEIDRIEVIRGPVSAVWGANAMTGVVNIITKTPREMAGTTLTIDYGSTNRKLAALDEDEQQDPGTFFSIYATHAQAVNDSFAFKVSAGALTESAFPRPVGSLPNDFDTPYPDFPNAGTTQPKMNFRLDFESSEGTPRKLTVEGGISKTKGIVHTGVGPFDIRRSHLSYARASYQSGNLKVGIFGNFFEGGGPALLTGAPATTPGGDPEPIVFLFRNNTFDIELSDFRPLGEKHLLVYGGNFRHNNFALSLAPGGDNRDEYGFFLQDEIFLSDRIRWIVGGRVDHFDLLGDLVFSPRTVLMLKPTSSQTLRLSFNRAFRAPSFINNYLDTVIVNSIDLQKVDPTYPDDEAFVYPVTALGSTDLLQETLTAYELGYTGIFADRFIVNAALFVNDTRDKLLFTETETYSSQSPPPDWPLAPEELDRLAAKGEGLAAELAYRNFEKVRNRGFELSLDARLGSHMGLHANYTWQDEPRPFGPGFDLSELNLPSPYLVNLGLDLNGGRFFGNLTASFVGEAVWQDVLDSRFHGPTRPFTLVNGTFGVRWEDSKVTTAIKVTNLLNEEIQQHVFGDVIKRQIVGELRFRF